MKLSEPNNRTYITLVVGVFGLNGALGLVRLLLYAYLLGPAQFGLFSLSQLMVTIGAYLSTLGFVEALNRQVPVFLGERKEKRANYFISLGLGFAVTTSVILSVLFFTIVFYVPVLGKYEPIVLVGSLLIATVTFNVICSGVRGYSLTLEAGVLTLLKTVLAATMGILASRYWGVTGVVLAEASALLLVALYMLRHYLPQVRPIIRQKRFYIPILVIGLPFLLSNIVLNLSQTIDSWYVQSGFPTEVYGQYAFAMIIFIAGQNFTSIIAQYVQPRVFTDFGKTKNHMELLAKLDKISIVVVLIFLVAWYPFSFFLEYGLLAIYPEYTEVQPLALFIYIGTAAMGVLGINESYVLARKKGRSLIVGYSLTLSIILSCCWLAKANELPLVYFAYIFCSGRLICLAYVMVLNRYLVTR